MIRTVIADDHEMFRQGLVSLLTSNDNADIVIVGEAKDGEEAVAIIKDIKPDLAIVDISMPKLNGLGVVEEIIRERIATEVIMLTMHNDPVLAAKAIRLGVSGYILKDNAIEDLLYAIKKIKQGGMFISPSISKETIKFHNKNYCKKYELTNREWEVLKLITKGLTNREIGKSLFISIKTVETHRAKIMTKLNLHNTADLVRYAMENEINIAVNHWQEED